MGKELNANKEAAPKKALVCEIEFIWMVRSC